jgi:hypothetical protein
VTEDEKLTGGAGLVRPPGNAEMIAAKLLGKTLDPRTAPAPFGFEKAATTVSGGFLKARRLGEDKPTESSKHLGQQGFEEIKQFFG